jgi:hypothetical protein
MRSIRAETALSVLLALATAATALATNPNSRDTAPGEVTFSKHVAPILQARCQGCHRPGQIGPMPLLTYAEARPWAKAIEREVTARTMPPWFAAPDSRPMKGDLNLSPEEMKTLTGWVRAGAPEGDPADLPPPRRFESIEGGWTLAKPDLVLRPQQAYDVPADATDEYRCYHVPLGVDHELWLKGVEFQPDNTAVVHHFILFGDSSGTARKLDEATPEPGWECGSMDSSLTRMKILQMWAPGNVQPLNPEGVGRRIDASSDLMLQIHYHNTTGTRQLDHSRFALHLAQPSETIQKEMRGQLVSAWTLDIPAGEPHVEHRATFDTTEDITVYATGVHMHYRGKDMGLWATLPDGARETLIWVPRYDFNWQLTYEFVEPLRAPKGTSFEMISHHDNSENNPHNPVLPPVDVKWGLASSDEMSFSGIQYTVDDEQLGITPRLPSEAVETGGE